MKRFCSILFFSIFFGGFIFAQEVTLQQMLDRSAAAYLKTISEESVLYYGNVQETLPRTTNHSYLEDQQYVKARLSYLGVVYHEAELRLDLMRHELVVLSPLMRHVVLFPENVDFAELHGRRVVFETGASHGSLSRGYYFLLHSGNCRVLERQSASLNRKDNNANILEEYYIISTRFFLYKDGVYHTIRSKRGLLQVLEPHKKELKRFISANHLSFRKHQGEFIVRSVVEYEKLSGL